MGIFGKKQQTTQAVSTQVQQGKADERKALSDEDRDLLEALAQEMVNCMVCADGEPLLTDAEGVDIATIPAPVIEIQYADFLVTLDMSVYRYTDEDR